MRFTLSPQVSIAVGARAKRPGDGMFGEPVELAVMENESDGSSRRLRTAHRRRDGR